MSTTKKVTRLTPELLRRVVKEEVSKFGKLRSTEDAAKDAEEVEAGDLADTLEKHIDMMKALKIEENRLKARLAKVQEQKAKLAQLLAK